MAKRCNCSALELVHLGCLRRKLIVSRSQRCRLRRNHSVLFVQRSERLLEDSNSTHMSRALKIYS
jgi:hypothetical protein